MTTKSIEQLLRDLDDEIAALVEIGTRLDEYLGKLTPAQAVAWDEAKATIARVKPQ
jgi:hypothetical protein